MSPEKENTFRSLKDEPLLMTSFWCKFGIHKWTKYNEPFKLGTRYRVNPLYPTGYYDIMSQEKRCVHCNVPSHRQYELFNRA